MSDSKTTRYRFTIDPDGTFEESNGEPRPLTPDEYAGNQYMRDGVPVPYEEYRAYYGNPDRHIYLGLIEETRCPCCGGWKETNSLWRIDMMDDDPVLTAITLDKRLDSATASALPGYAGELVRDMQQEGQK